MFKENNYLPEQSFKRQFATFISYFLFQFVLYLALILFFTIILRKDVNFFVENAMIFSFSISALSMVVALLINIKFLKSQIKETKFSSLIDRAFQLTLIGLILNIILILLFTTTTSQNQEMVETLLVENKILMILLAVIIAPITEELTFRLGLQGLISRKSKFFGAITSLIIFVGIHLLVEIMSGELNLSNVVGYLGISSLLSFVYYKTNNVLLTILIHMLYNGFAIFVFLYLSQFTN